MLRSIGKQYGESMKSVLEKKEDYSGMGFAEKEGFLSLKRKSEG